MGKGKRNSLKKYSIKDCIAKNNISWFDAIEITRQYSAYLSSAEAKSAKTGSVPLSSDKSSAFARLPTDSEWEFAARGGSHVTSSEFSADVFPFAQNKTIADYAWYKASESASDGKVRPIGLKDPNPAGLYDVLGNVSEMMLDPFYATRTGRLHGQSGGFIVRGGSVINARPICLLLIVLKEPTLLVVKRQKVLMQACVSCSPYRLPTLLRRYVSSMQKYKSLG